MQNYPALEQQDREKVEIFAAVRGLPFEDSSSRNGLQIVMQIQNQQSKLWSEAFRTEAVIINKLSNYANYAKSYVMDYIFEFTQQAKFLLCEEGRTNQFLCESSATIGQIVGSRNSTLIIDLKDSQTGKFAGKLILRAEKVTMCNDEIFLKVNGRKLKDLRFWSKSSPFLVFMRSSENMQPIKVLETEKVENNLNPQFKRISIKAQKLCNGDYNMPIIVECWDYNDNGKHDFIGSTTFSINQIVQNNVKEFKLVNKKKNEDTGFITFVEAKLKEKPQFLDYIRGGIHLNLICAIDFTGSNGVPTRPDSLHAIFNNGQMNQYQHAINSVGKILLDYDEDKMIPLYGFGAKPKLPNFSFPQTLHCFPVNGNPQQPSVHALQGLMDTYTYFLKFVELSGPTLFNPLIQESMKAAQNSKDTDDGNYYILLILTDGEIHDMDLTVSSIVASSRLPMSIIIIGIGNADFTNMEILDGDNGLIDCNGKKAERDLVQFVPYNQFKNDPEQLASTVLEELPTQLVEYYQLINKKPNQLQAPNIQSIQPNIIPASNAAFGQNLIKAGFMNRIMQNAMQEPSNSFPFSVNSSQPPVQFSKQVDREFDNISDIPLQEDHSQQHPYAFSLNSSSFSVKQQQRPFAPPPPPM